MVRLWQLVICGLMVSVSATSESGQSPSGPNAVDVDCELSAWEPTSGCATATLTQTFARTITKAPQGNGRQCGALSETRGCQPVHCELSKWTPWGACAEDGYKTRTRTLTTAPLYGGRECPRTVDAVKCFANDCRVSAWSDWVYQADGIKTRTRRVTRAARGDGAKCPDQLVESAPCDPVNCVLGQEPWGPWGACDPSTGTQTRTRPEAIPAKFGGVPCNTSDMTEQRSCAVNCVLFAENDPSNGDFGACSRATAYRTKVLQVQYEARNGGAACPTEAQRTVKKPCTLDAWFRTLASEWIMSGSGNLIEFSASGELLAFQRLSPKTSIGKITASPITADAQNTLFFGGGQMCSNGPRTLTLSLVCGESPIFYDFSEPSMCGYVAKLRLPVAPACASDCVRWINVTASATLQSCLVG